MLLLPLSLMAIAASFRLPKYRGHRRVLGEPKVTPAKSVVKLHPSIVYSATAIARRGANGDTVLVDGAPSLGIVRLMEESRRRMLFIFARPGSVTYVGARLTGVCREKILALERGATLVPEGIFPDLPFVGDRCLAGVDAEKLLKQSRALAPWAIDRVVCASCDTIDLDLAGSALISGDMSVDLEAPLVWRPLAFHETGGGVGGVFQGTWVVQGGASVVFVSPIPTLFTPPGPPDGDMEIVPHQPVDPAADADALARAMSPAADPPPVHLRVSVDSLLMFPLRAALAHARSARRERAPWHRYATAIREVL